MHVSKIFLAALCFVCKAATSYESEVDCKESDFAAIAQTLDRFTYVSSAPVLGLSPQEWKKWRDPTKRQETVGSESTERTKEWLLFKLLGKQNELKEQCTPSNIPSIFVSLETAKKIASRVFILGKAGEKQDMEERKGELNRARQKAVSLHILASLSEETILAARYLVNKFYHENISKWRSTDEAREKSCEFATDMEHSIFREDKITRQQQKDKNYLGELYLFLLRRYRCLANAELEGLIEAPTDAEKGKEPLKSFISSDNEGTEADVKGGGSIISEQIRSTEKNEVDKSYSDPMVEVEILFRLGGFLRNLNVYFAKLGLAGITAAETAARVQVQASLAELASRAIDQIEKLNQMEKSLNKMITQTFAQIQTYAAPTK